MSIFDAALFALAVFAIAAAAVFILRKRSRGERPLGEDLKADVQGAPTRPADVGWELGEVSIEGVEPQEDLVAKGGIEDQPAQGVVGQAGDADGEGGEESGGKEVEEDNLLSLFRTEEVEDLSLRALTESLEDIDARELLKECRSIASWLRRRSQPSQPAS
ncbi:MAG TPA: hypothetical protein G4O03_03835 [Dehalococcoidia bacterium]|nr:hypothetical protein [Dehalococcoidia bacterium]